MRQDIEAQMDTILVAYARTCLGLPPNSIRYWHYSITLCSRFHHRRLAITARCFAYASDCGEDWGLGGYERLCGAMSAELKAVWSMGAAPIPTVLCTRVLSKSPCRAIAIELCPARGSALVVLRSCGGQ